MGRHFFYPLRTEAIFEGQASHEWRLMDMRQVDSSIYSLPPPPPPQFTVCDEQPGLISSLARKETLRLPIRQASLNGHLRC